MRRTSTFLNLYLILGLIFLVFSFPGSLWADEWQELFPTTKPSARYGHTMVELNGNLYVFGGSEQVTGSDVMQSDVENHRASGQPMPMGAPMNDLWKYDPTQNSWNQLTPSSSPRARQSHSAAVSNGKMYIFFGVDSSYSYYYFLDDIWSYDPNTNSWKQEPSGGAAPPPRVHHSSVALPDGRILIFGGMGSDGKTADPFVWSYNPANGTWERKGALITGGLYGHGAAVTNGKMYLYGGYEGYESNSGMLVYDPIQDTWGIMPPARYFPAVAALLNKIYVFGGEAPATQQPLNDSWEFDTSTNAWTQCASVPMAVSTSAAAALSNFPRVSESPSDLEEGGDSVSPAIVLFGGESAGARTNRMFVYFPEGAPPPPPSGYALTVIKTGTGSGTVTSNPAGINCGSDCSETYSKVQSVKLTAKADTNSTFTGWSGGGCSGTGTCQVTVDSAITVTTGFSLKAPNISVGQTSLDFGDVKVGKSVKKKLAIRNNGEGELSITLEGLGGTDFSTSGSSIKIKSKKIYNLEITFKPTSTGTKTATLKINSNDPDAATIDVQLSGTGE